MPANALFIDERKRAHVLVVPQPTHYGPCTFRERPFTLVTLVMSEGRWIWTDDRKHGPLLRARGSILDRALSYIDLPTLAADLDARVVETKEAFDQAFDDAREAYENERSRHLAAAAIPSTTQRSISALASA